MDFLEDPVETGNEIQMAKSLHKLPSVVQAVLRPALVKKYRKIHYGQVAPIEAVEEILRFASSVTRLPCIWRAYCTKDAITLHDRAAVSEAANSW